MDICFIDIETTGLDPDRHTITEIAFLRPGMATTAFCCFFDLTVEEHAVATPKALELNHYYQRANHPIRHPDGGFIAKVPPHDRRHTAFTIAELTSGCVLAGAGVHFDQRFLETWMRRHGACPAWDYHVIDIPTYAAGYLGGVEPPFTTKKISDAYSVKQPEGDDKHTAYHDALWCKRVWDAIHG